MHHEPSRRIRAPQHCDGRSGFGTECLMLSEHATHIRPAGNRPEAFPVRPRLPEDRLLCTQRLPDQVSVSTGV